MWYFLNIPPQVERMGLRMALWLSGSFDFGSSCGAGALRAEALTTHAALLSGAKVFRLPQRRREFLENSTVIA